MSNVQSDMGLRWWERQREQMPGFELIPHLFRLLAQGEPVTLERLAAASASSAEDVGAAVRSHSGVDWDDRGRIVGFGLTLRPTPHRFTFDGRTVFAFCASDTLIFPVVLGRAGVIESTCPSTKQSIHVDVTPKGVVRVEPESAVVSLVRPSEVGDVRAEVCALGSFFASKEAAAAWLAAYPQGAVHGVREDFELHRGVMEKLGWAAS